MITDFLTSPPRSPNSQELTTLQAKDFKANPPNLVELVATPFFPKKMMGYDFSSPTKLKLPVKKHPLRSPLTGQFKVLFPNGGFLEGNFQDSRLHGLGKCLLPEGTVTRGEFQNGQFIRGTMILANGIRIMGDFINGRIHGTLTLKNGTVSEGIFENFKLTGQGKIMEPNGTVIAEGQFKNDKLHGLGLRVSSDGWKIREEGEFQDGLLHGQAKKTYITGVIEEGHFENGRLHGQGKVIYPDGTVKEGEYRKGVLIKKNQKSICNLCAIL